MFIYNMTIFHLQQSSPKNNTTEHARLLLAYIKRVCIVFQNIAQLVTHWEKLQIYQILIKVKSLWSSGWKCSYRKHGILVGCSHSIIVSTYWMSCMDNEMKSVLPAVCRPRRIDRRRERGLLRIIHRDRWATTAPTFAIHTVLLNTQWLVRCCVWIYSAGG